jgi:hypothetical protein
MIKRKEILFSAIIFLLSGCNQYNLENSIAVNRFPLIFPDYIEITIPPNIAPLNFQINEKGEAFFVRISGKIGKPIAIKSKKQSIYIDINEWHRILENNKGNDVLIEIYVKNEKNQWQKFNGFKNKIASEKIENFLAYRLINTGYVLWKKMGIYQRNLENFDEYPIFLNSSSDEGCVNCHSFCKRYPQKMILHLRSIHPGTILINENQARLINTKTKFTMSPCVYPSWHPDGKLIAFSVNIIGQNFSTSDSNRIEVSDKASDIVIYDLTTNTITTSPKISTKNRENLPEWSPDGKWLYFISAPEAKNDYERIYAKYDLMRISYNAKTNIWGDVETVLSSKKTGLSISFPKISPDGRFLMFCMSDHGYFTIYHSGTDLYLMDLNTREYHKMAMNSDFTESYHSWSGTNRWFVFASKRIDGLYTRPFFCYINENGEVAKPFVMPQKEPIFYNTFLKNYNIPELISGKVTQSPLKLRNLAYTDPLKANFDTTVDVDALSGATWLQKK